MNKELWDKCVKFHGHECPGLAIGFKAAEAAIKKLGIEFSTDEEIVCVTENDACGVDAIQVILGCTFGKGNLIFRNRGKSAYSFFERNTKKSIRVVLKPFNSSMDRKERQEYLLNSLPEDIFEFKKPHYSLPEKARIFKTIICEKCGEGAADHKVRLTQDKKVCLDCFEEYTREF